MIVYVALAWATLAASLTVKYDLSSPAVELGAGVLDTITDTVAMLTNVPTPAFIGFLLVQFFHPQAALITPWASA